MLSVDCLISRSILRVEISVFKFSNFQSTILGCVKMLRFSGATSSVMISASSSCLKSKINRNSFSCWKLISFLKLWISGFSAFFRVERSKGQSGRYSTFPIKAVRKLLAKFSLTCLKPEFIFSMSSCGFAQSTMLSEFEYKFHIAQDSFSERNQQEAYFFRCVLRAFFQ